MVKNLENVIQKSEDPVWIHRTVKSVSDYWKEHWAKPRAEKRKEYLDFFADKFMVETLEELKKYMTEQTNKVQAVKDKKSNYSKS